MKKRSRLFFAGVCCIFSLCSCDGEDMVFEASEDSPATYEPVIVEDGPIRESNRIMVYVCGAVLEPGVVALDAEARVVDAIALAGGMTSEADTDYVNLAARLQDGEKIYIPTAEEVLSWETKQESRNLVNINTADAKALCALPGIGESKAQDIILYREEHGSFQSPEDIMKVPGIKESLFQKIKNYVIVE